MAFYTRVGNLTNFPALWSVIEQWSFAGTANIVGGELRIDLLNTDGTYTQIYGTGIVLDVNNIPTSGSVTAIERVDIVQNPGSTSTTRLERLDTSAAPYDLVTLYNDIITGQFPDNVLGGDDTFSGGGGNGGILEGYLGDDTFIGYGDDLTIGGGEGDDTIEFIQSQNATIAIDGGADDDRVLVDGFSFTETFLFGTVDGGTGTDALVARDDLSGLTIVGFEQLLVSHTYLFIDPVTLSQFADIRMLADETVADPTSEVWLYLSDSGTVDFSANVSPGILLQVFASNLGNTLTGHAGSDAFIGGTGLDVLNGGDGGDFLVADGNGRGNSAGFVDILNGGGGNDDIAAQLFDDAFFGAAVGNLTIAIDGGTGDDLIIVSDGSAAFSLLGTIDGGADTDTLLADGDISALTLSSVEQLTLTEIDVATLGTVTATAAQFNSFLVIAPVNHPEDPSFTPYTAITLNLASPGTVSFEASVANTLALTVNGSSGSDDITGHAGVDLLFGGGEGDTLVGRLGADTLDGGTGADTMLGGDGSDIYYVDNVGDVVTETSASVAVGGTDRVISSITYTLPVNVESLTMVGTGNIVGNGNGSNNFMSGNAQANTLRAWGGNDVFIPGLGNDWMSGGIGQDFFVFNAALGPNNRDGITDFVHADDTIRLDDAIFAAVGPLGTLAASAFHVGTAAADALDRIIYNTANGQILYDADGLGGAAAVLFATLTNKPQDIDRTDFVII